MQTWAGMQNALQATDLFLNGCTITLEAVGQSKKLTIPSLIGDPDAPAALIKNPMRTVAIKQLTHKICPRHIEEALAFCESNISGVFLGSSDSVAYVEFKVYHLLYLHCDHMQLNFLLTIFITHIM